MPSIEEYHSPTELPVALSLLQRRHPRTVPLAGGTWLVPRIGREVEAQAVVDLRHLGLDELTVEANTLQVGAMTTLAAIIKDPTCQTVANGILASTARRDAALNVRNAATVGGTIMVCPVDGVFNLALLALAATLELQSNTVERYTLADFLTKPAARPTTGILSQIQIKLDAAIRGGLSFLGRTPGDHPIVAAVAALSTKSLAGRIAIGGVAERPLLVAFDELDQAQAAVDEAIAAAPPYASFSGTAEYRSQMGTLMAERALQQAVANCDR